MNYSKFRGLCSLDDSIHALINFYFTIMISLSLLKKNTALNEQQRPANQSQVVDTFDAIL